MNDSSLEMQKPSESVIKVEEQTEDVEGRDFSGEIYRDILKTLAAYPSENTREK